MPIYPVRCPACHAVDDVYCSMKDREHLACAKCGNARVETQYDKLNISNGDREFDLSRRESVIHFFPPDEVQDYRQLYGDAGNCIKDDGTVVFNRRSEERKFRQAKQAHEARLDAQQREHDAKRADLMHADGEGKRRGDGQRRAKRLAKAT